MMNTYLKLTHLTAMLTLAFAFATYAQEGQPAQSTVDQLKQEAAALAPNVTTPIAKEFLGAVDELPSIAARTMYRDRQTRNWISPAEYESLSPEARENVEVRPANEQLYYYTRYGTPLAYVRVLELAGKHGVKQLAGAKILDFGYGTIGHLRLMAACGTHAVGMDVDPFLTALYSQPGDTGEIINSAAPNGRVTLVSGKFADEEITSQVGDGYDLITSKNTLKRGYIHPPPEENVDPRMLVDLGVSDEQFLKIAFNALKPNGLFVIYNLSPKPAPPGEKYIPWADGRCPFDRATIEAAGFEIITFDLDDKEAAHAMARAFGWEKGMDLETDLFAHVTIMRRPR